MNYFQDLFPSPTLWEVRFKDFLRDNREESITVLASIALEAQNKAYRTNVGRKLCSKGYSIHSIKPKV